MVLTAANLFHYLADAGIAEASWVTDEQFQIADLSRRNHAFRVQRPGRAGMVVKQIGAWEPLNVTTFEAEAHWYWLLRERPEFAPLARFSGQCRAYDAADQILILEAPEGCEDLEQHHARSRTCPVATAELLGTAMAEFHTALPADALAKLRDDFPPAAPWVFSWHDTDPAKDEKRSEGRLALQRIVRDQPVFAVEFEKLRADWHPSAVINGDMKFAHCILADGGKRIYFIDWEMASYGDPLWDVAGILQEYVRLWLRSMPGGSETAPEDLAQTARTPLASLQPAIRAFWRTYCDRAGIADRAAAIERAARFAAAWLLQSAYQNLREAESMSALTVRMLQVSANLLAAPAEGVRALWGIADDES